MVGARQVDLFLNGQRDKVFFFPASFIVFNKMILFFQQLNRLQSNGRAAISTARKML